MVGSIGEKLKSIAEFKQELTLFLAAAILIIARPTEFRSQAIGDATPTPTPGMLLPEVTEEADFEVETVLEGELFKITGFPETATPRRFSTDATFANGIFATSIGEPGVYTTSNSGDENIVSNGNPDGSAYFLGGKIQETLTALTAEGHIIAEGRGTSMFTGAAMKITLATGEVLDFKGEENHSWLILVRGKERDGSTPGDRNIQAIVSDYTAGAAMRTELPPGMFVSANYVLQNTNTAFSRDNCGADGCARVSVATVELEEGVVTVATGTATFDEEGVRTVTWTTQASNWSRSEE